MSTITVSVPHTFAVGQQITISGSTPHLPRWVLRWENVPLASRN